MKVYKHEPQNILRISIRRGDEPIQFLSIMEATSEEFEAFVRNLIGRQNLSPFEKGKVTGIDIRSAVGQKNGKTKSISFRGLSPIEVKKLIENELKQNSHDGVQQPDKMFFAINDEVWLFDGDDYRKETVVRYDGESGMYELSDGNIYEPDGLFKTKMLNRSNAVQKRED